MTFQSFHFLAFLVLVVFLTWRLDGRPAWRKSVLLVASYYFYMAWDWRFAVLLVLLTIVNYGAGAAIAKAESLYRRRLWLAFAVTVCLGVLAYFKYAGFFLDSLQRLLAVWGWQLDLHTAKILLPVGISFYTFQSLSYVLDVYRREELECRSLLDFSLFVAFFPTVLAGPITRARDLLPQFQTAAPISPSNVEHGMALILRGFIKKIAFADVLALHWVTPAFSDPTSYSSLFLLLALYAYTFQIYMDVSAYTDIARGAASMCGFVLPENFDRPYIASTVSNFWQRWHISMSSFFRDYLYFGLGGSQRGNVYLNLMLTFTAIGIWHGAGWNFIVYGLLHGSAVCVERWRRGRRQSLGLEPTPTTGWAWFMGVFVTFHFVVFSRVLFRAPDLDLAGQYMGAVLALGSGAFPMSVHALLVLLLCACLHWLFPRAGLDALRGFMSLSVPMQAVTLVCAIYLLMALSMGAAPFVYFQF